MKLSGRLRTHQGLRFVPVNVRAMDYTGALITVHRGVEPAAPRDADALEFCKMTMGMEILLQVSDDLYPADMDEEQFQAHLAIWRRYLRTAQQLQAKSLIFPAFDIRVNGQCQWSPQHLSTFFDEIEPFEGDVIFRVGQGIYTLSKPNRLMDMAYRSFNPERFGLALNPAQITLDWTDQQLEDLASTWGRYLRLITLNTEREHLEGIMGFLRKFSHVPVVLEHPSLTVQAEVAEYLRGFEETDILLNITETG